MTTSLHADRLLTYQGRVVPWVTRWTGEVIRVPVTCSQTPDGLRVDYSDGNQDRDPDTGILWQREGIMRGGTPEFAQVSTYRQRLAMRGPRCQICGQKIDERPIQWLLPTGMLDYHRDTDAVTISAPTCAACIPVALELCPHLRRTENIIAHVLDYERWGAHGTAVVLDKDGTTVHQIRNVMYSYRTGRAGVNPGAMIAKQLAVMFTKFTIEHLDGTPQ